jgi:hypothetical protein
MVRMGEPPTRIVGFEGTGMHWPPCGHMIEAAMVRIGAGILS